MFMVNYKCGVENCESLFKMSKVLKNKIGGGDDYHNLWMPC